MLETLKAARALIADPKHWTRGTFARDANGEPCASGAVEAVCFCALGALKRVAPSWTLVDAIQQHIYNLDREALMLGVAGINDNLGHAAVLALFDRVIAHLEKA